MLDCSFSVIINFDMPNTIKIRYLYIAILVIVVSCTKNNKTPPANVDFQILASSENLLSDPGSRIIVNMGWMANDQIFFGVGSPFSYNSNLVQDMEKLKWYFYDPIQLFASGVDEDQIPFYGVTSTTSKMLPVDGILSYITSPDKTSLLYTKLPDGYEKPSGDALPLDYIDPVELWASQDDAEKIPLLAGEENWYACGSSLSPESKWLLNNTLVFGTCTGAYPNYFLVDLENKNFQPLNLYLDMEYFPVNTISIANKTASLALISDDTHQLWMIPAEAGQKEINTHLTQANLLFSGTASAPVWSSDDRWIYYWAFDKPDAANSDVPEYQDWWLEKINIITAERRVVLSRENILSFMPEDMYQLSSPLATGNIWRLSPDERKIILFLNETSKSPATLFMISID